jgi:ubiquinone/menaquinone biosynthesis C-methylase UbiE
MNTAAQWQLEGHAAELYERCVHRYILGPWVAPLLDVAGLRPGDRVLDVACGTGAVARVAAQRVGISGRVTGLDLNAGMLTVARSLAAPPGAAISWIERSALDTGLPDRGFDVVVCQQGLQFFADKTAALREMRRVLVPRGRLAISVWRSTGIYNAALGQALKEHLSVDVGSRFCASRDVPSDEELRRHAVAAGFQDVMLHVQRQMVRLPALRDFALAHLAATPVAAAVRAMSEAARAALGADVARQLAAYAEGDGVAFPEEVNVITAVA